jgi:hypothetical protein
MIPYFLGGIPTSISVRNFMGNVGGILLVGGSYYTLSGGWTGQNSLQLIKMNSSQTPSQYETKTLNSW